jgi:hypothetical protein
MEHSSTLPTIMVTLTGPHLSRQTVSEALQAVRVDNVEVTWRSEAGGRDDDPWRITVATGRKVSVGALPRGRQSARELAACLNALIAGH